LSGRGNLSYNRMQVKGPRKLGFNVNEWRHVHQFLDVQEAQEKALPIAVAIGLDPAIMIAAGARYPDDELLIAGAIRGEAIKVTPGVTVNIDVPTEAEIVIEGYLGPREREEEGPLAEFHGYFGELWKSPVFHVTAICWRDDPIFQTIIPGWNEHVYLGNVLPREPLLLDYVEHVSKEVTGLHIPPYGSGFTAIVALDKTNPGQPKNVAMAAFTAHVNVKWCIVVDSDVDIYDPADVLWALTTRVDWEKDVFLVPGAQGHEMDPTSDARGVQTKVGIDATFPEDGRDYKGRVRYQDVDLSRYL
jgi:2,5-furandicarboxylate decarboxylase 1